MTSAAASTGSPSGRSAECWANSVPSPSRRTSNSAYSAPDDTTAWYAASDPGRARSAPPECAEIITAGRPGWPS